MSSFLGDQGCPLGRFPAGLGYAANRVSKCVVRDSAGLRVRRQVCVEPVQRVGYAANSVFKCVCRDPAGLRVRRQQRVQVCVEPMQLF